MPGKALQFWIEECLGLIFPRICAACDDNISVRGHISCMHCLAAMPLTGEAYVEGNRVEQQFYGRTRVRAAASLMYFLKGGVAQGLLHKLKYQQSRSIATYLGRTLGTQLVSSERFNDVHYVIPVPLHPEKLKDRGYNQSEYIARGMSHYLGIPVVTDVLIRTRHTSSQTRLSRIERVANVSSAFTVNDSVDLDGKHLLLVDDVITTGATLEACISALHTFFSVDISVAVIASGQL